tara:strand:- start:6372 stop:8894 length:2523 start_codon:yes stop_codon:yes gene_type:complete
MAGFLNAFNKSFERPGEQADIDPNEQRRYAKMAQEDLTNTGGVRWDVASEGIVGDIDKANDVDKRRLLRGTSIPSIAADGSIVEFDISDLMQEEDGSWVVGLKNPQTGEDTIVTDTSDANPNGNVTKFTTEQINNALANKYRSLATLSGGNDRILSGQIGADLVSLARDNRKANLDNEQRRLAEDAKSVQQGEKINAALKLSEKTKNINATRGVLGATPGQLEDYLSSMTPSVDSAETQAANSLFPERASGQEQLQQNAPPPVAAPPESALDLDMVDEQEAAFLAEGPVYNVDIVPTSGVSVGDNYITATTGRKQVIGKEEAAVLYPELAKTDFAVTSGSISTKTSNAIKGAEYVRALNKNGAPINLEENSFINKHWDVIGENVSVFQQRDKERQLPAGTTLSLVQGFADIHEQEAVNLDTSKYKSNIGRQGRINSDKRKLRNPNRAVAAAVMSQASLDEVDSLDDDNTTRQTLVDPAYLPALKKDQNNSGSFTDALNTDAVKKVVSPDGSLNEDAAKAVIEQGREVAEKEGFNSAEALANVDRSLSNDVKVQRAITAAAMAASIQTNANGTNTFDQGLYNTLFGSNWNTYTTGDPNISIKDLMGKTTSGSATRVSNWIDATKNWIGKVDTPLATAATNLNALQVQSGTSLFGLISTWSIKTSGPKEEELVKSIATFKTAAAESLEQLTRFKEQIKLGSDFINTNVPDAYQGTIKRLEDGVVTNLLISAGLSREAGGLAAWVASWGVEDQQFDAFTNLDNFIIVPSKDGVTKNTRIMAIDSNGNPRNTEFTVGQLENSINKKNANKLVSILLERQKNNERTAKLLKERGEGGDVFTEKTR